MLFKNKLNTLYCFNAKKFFGNKSDSTCMNNVMGGGGGRRDDQCDRMNSITFLSLHHSTDCINIREYLNTDV